MTPPALFYQGCLNALVSEPGMGKTWIALKAAAEVAEGGAGVLYLDYEGNRRIVGSRLHTMRVPKEAVANIAYVQPPHIGAAERSALVEIVKERQIGLVVIDGVAKSLARQGWSEDKATDVLDWMELLCWPLTGAGAAVLTLDHVIKDKEHQGRYARGSSAKLAEIDGVQFGLKGGKFSRDKGGRVKLIIQKDREGAVGAEGDVAAVVVFEPAGEHLDMRIEPWVPSSSDDGPRFVPTECMGKIEAFLRANAGKFYAKDTIVEGVRPMRKETALEAIAELVRTGVLHIDTESRWPRYGVPRHLHTVPLEPEEPPDLEF